MSIDRPTLRLLHTADVHIGDEYHAARRLQGFTAVVDAALAHQVHALLIVGDLFDSARVGAADVGTTLQQLARLSCPVVITAGNHDSLDSSSIYRRIPLAQAGDHVHLMDNPDGDLLVLHDLRLAIWSRALVDHHPGHRPLAGYRPAAPAGYWRVVMAHGHFVPTAEQTDRSSPILQQEIAGLACDYVALGHWHRFLDCSANGVPAFYPGSPSETGGSFPSANLVTLDPLAGTRIDRVPLP